MLGEWPEVSLEDLCDLIVDCPHSTPEWTDSGVVVLRNQYIRGGRLDLSNPSYTTEEGYLARIKRAIPSAGDLVLTREAPMGEVCQIPEGLKCCLGQRMVLLRPAPEKVDSEFLLFSLQSPYLQHQINWSEGTGTTVSNIRLPDLRAFKVPVPSLQVQKAIAGILKALDDKIELNRQINATLESMAQALFKSWFVDFDPVIDNALAVGNPIPEPLQARADKRAGLHVWTSDEDARRASATEGASHKRAALLAAASAADTRSASATDNAHPTQTAPHTQPDITAPATPLQPLPADLRALFPDSFVFNEEMGWVPEGGSSGLLSDVAKLITKSIHPGKQPDKLWMHFSIPAFDENQRPSVDLGESIKSGKYMVPKESVLASKLNPEFPRIWLPDVVSEDDAVCSTEFMPFVPINSEDRPFLYLLLKSEAIQTEISNRATGSTGSRQRVKPKEIEALPMLHPSKELRIAFSSHVKGMLDRIRLNSGNNETLARVRDALLPKLLSGQIQLPEVERKYAEAAQ